MISSVLKWWDAHDHHLFVNNIKQPLEPSFPTPTPTPD
jgi:hypothetical protein